MNKMTQQTLFGLLSGSGLDKDELRKLLDSLVDLTSIIEGSGAPSFAAKKHQWYFDTSANKYYRNVNGGTTWVALN